MGLDCRHCSQAQRRKCKEDWLYGDCPKAIKLESLNKPVIGEDGELTELGELIADDKAIDLDAWVSSSTWEIGYPKRLVAIAYRLKAGTPLSNGDLLYLRACEFIISWVSSTIDTIKIGRQSSYIQDRLLSALQFKSHPYRN